MINFVVVVVVVIVHFIKNYHNGKSILIPYIFGPTFGNCFMKVILNERLPREKMDILQE